MSRPKNADGQRTRRAILDAALDLFADKGFFGTSLRDIAAAVGVRESALYNYFAGKDALFEELIVSGHEEKTERLQAIVADTRVDARTSLERIAIAILESHAEPRQQQLFRVLLSDGIRLARNGRLNLLERMGNAGQGPLHELLARLMLQGALRNGDQKTLAVAFVGPLLLWRHVRALDADRRMFGSIESFAAEHVDQFLHGAAAPRAADDPSRSRRRSRPSSRRRPSVRRLS